MGVGPNYVLDKPFVATGAAAYNYGDVVVQAGTGTSVARATAAAAKCLGVCQENVDLAKVQTGKAVIDVRLLGIARVKAGTGGVAVGDRVTNDTNAAAVTVAVAVGLKESFGVALTAATAGNYFDVLLTPFASVNTAVS